MISKNGHLRILLIEDNKDDEKLIKLALQREYKPIIKRVETEAGMMLALERDSWDVILCDYLLPAFSAEKALEIVKERLVDIPFIMLSGLENEELALEMLKRGANDFIYKTQIRREDDTGEIVQFPRLALAIKRELKEAADRAIGRIEIEKTFSLTIEAWGKALEKRDIYTKNHTVRVTDLTLLLARALGVSSAQFRDIYYGSLLHDIGKIGIPDIILLKPEPLDAAEMSIMRMHPGLAYEMLSPIPFFEKAINIPYCHHEKFDGTGYPRGLEGDRIPYEARIFSVTDVWDALTNDRPYRKSWSREKALEYMKEERGRSFDPAILDKFMEIIKWQ